MAYGSIPYADISIDLDDHSRIFLVWRIGKSRSGQGQYTG
jgi:hypothetical protein